MLQYAVVVPKRGSVADLKRGLTEMTQIKKDMVRKGKKGRGEWDGWRENKVGVEFKKGEKQ